MGTNAVTSVFSVRSTNHVTSVSFPAMDIFPIRREMVTMGAARSMSAMVGVGTWMAGGIACTGSGVGGPRDCLLALWKGPWRRQHRDLSENLLVELLLGSQLRCLRVVELCSLQLHSSPRCFQLTRQHFHLLLPSHQP